MRKYLEPFRKEIWEAYNEGLNFREIAVSIHSRARTLSHFKDTPWFQWSREQRLSSLKESIRTIVREEKDREKPFAKFRSFDWYQILPREVAREQLIWEREAAVIRMRDELGFTWYRAGRHLGITHSRASQLYKRGKRKRTYYKDNASPIERYFDSPVEIVEMARDIKRKRLNARD